MGDRMKEDEPASFGKLASAMVGDSKSTKRSLNRCTPWHILGGVLKWGQIWCLPLLNPPFEGLSHVVQTPKLFHSMSNILLVDDHPVMRALLRQVLEAYPDIVIVAEAEDGEEAVRLATKFQPDVAIIDLHLPRLSGAQATKLIRLQSPCTAIIGLTAGEPDDREMEIISAGASAVLNKADVFQELHRSIVKAVRLAAFYPAHLNKPVSDCKAGS
jgi:CheY-like chemotaxis protein